MDKKKATWRTSVFIKSSLAQSYCHQLICLSEYYMGQWTTGVNQPLVFLVFNAADNALDRFDVSRV
jgi:hypothetical protein